MAVAFSQGIGATMLLSLGTVWHHPLRGGSTLLATRMQQDRVAPPGQWVISGCEVAHA